MNEKLTIKAQINASINFAMQQNYVPVIRDFIVTNNSGEKLENIHINITFEPGFAHEFSYDVAAIEAGESIEVSPVKIVLSPEFLFSLTEKVVGNIYIKAYESEELIYDYEETIELLAYDEWSGLFIMPEIIAAFATPNHPDIAKVLSEACEYLKKWSDRPAFTGYQTKNPNNVKLQMAAIYAALKSCDIVYNNPPASYEGIGQRIRLPHKVLEQKQGTCLDLSMLYATCLEAVGIYPLIVFTKGHAFVGARLEEETFADCVIDDVSALEKRIVEGSEEVLLVECTDFTIGKNVDFEKAIKHGNNHISEISEFVCFIDVQRCRASGIRPIPLRLEQIKGYDESNADIIGGKLDKVKAPEELNIIEMPVNNVEVELTKQKVWERKLLDFSLRNSLLNFRVNKNSLQLMFENLGELEDKLSEGNDFRIMEVPSEWTLTLRDAKMYEIENEKDVVQTIAIEEFKNNRIRTFLDEADLTKSLKSIYRAAKVSIEENGTNTLFLALGFLRWFESDISEQPRMAPIVLLPIDIVKSTRNKGYVIRSRQEDAQINITLLEYLRQIFEINIAGLDPLPTDDHGIDLTMVFNIIRQAIMDKKRWNIENKAVIGLFSFGQFVMWNDIRNRSKEIEANKVVSSLIEGKINWDIKEQTISLENLDEKLAPSQMAIPMSADSSQLVAITRAAGGESFVLHGPPGTGKSQTITNMIANALYQGKSVLFVAEKMAALNVVQNRLASIGLDPFCLELHSNKTNKSNVLGQLNKALEVGRVKAPEEYKETADRVHNLRKSLNAVIDALHAKRDYGCSVYEAIQRFEMNKSEKGKVTFSPEFINTVSAESIATCNDVIRQYVVALKDVTEYADSPFKSYEGTEYSIELRDDFEKMTKELLDLLDVTSPAVDTMAGWANVSASSVSCIREFVALADMKKDNVAILPELLTTNNYDEMVNQLKMLCDNGNQYSSTYKYLDDTFETQIFNYNVDEAILKYNKAQMSWFLPKTIGTGKLVKELKMYAKKPELINKENLREFYNKINSLKGLRDKIRQTPSEITRYTGDLYAGVDTNWENVIKSLDKTKKVYEFLKAVPSDRQNAYINTLLNASCDENLTKNVEIVDNFSKKWSAYVDKFKINESVIDNGFINDVNRTLRCVFEGYLENVSELKNWVVMQQKASLMLENKMDNVVLSWHRGSITSDNVQSAFDANMYYELILKTIREDDRLKGFQGKQYEDTIAQYEELIEKFRTLTIQELVAKLSAEIPLAGVSSASTSEIGILKKAIKSNGRMLSIRKLFDEIPNLLRRLCPCMLMSPISVAQYIDPSFPKFDLVIFDEASQLPTSEAVGTIARGENVVIVGDPNQLPPTSFFSSNHVDEDNLDKEDLESLLDDCLSISMPQEHLKWHYRSRHESLIAYSNMKYYDNKLYTFPSPNDLVSQVKLVHVDGYYDKGKTKQNKEEARAVVNEIIRRLSDENLRNDSIGVVTFSSVQQNLIDDMLAEELVKYPELDDFDKKSKEPIFVKNLENVQGDERDVILFSVGYGPDKEGKVSMNFGPLNRDGGWRRLNVAISRARKSMIVYSTLRPEQIELSRTRAEGLAGLKGFLEFADRGKTVLATKAGIEKTETDNLVTQIADAIKSIGYDVRYNIGCSAYKMDIGIVDNDNPDTYLLGILLDGKNCKEAATSRDRFVLQPNVLKGLGWNIMRVWTLEWLDNQEKVLKDIQNELERVLSQEEVVAEQTNSMPNEELVFEQIDMSEVLNGSAVAYKSYEVESLGAPEEMFEPESKSKMTKLVRNILMTEAPVSRNVLMKKVLSAWGISRVTAKVTEYFDEALLNNNVRETKELENVFYWNCEQIPQKYEEYRVEETENRRSMDEISAYEIVNAIRDVIAQQISLSKQDLVRETAKKFGYARLGNVIETTINNAIDVACEMNVVEVTQDDKVKAPESIENF